MANRRLADNPHISTPVRLSTGPKVRQMRGRTISPYPTVEKLVIEKWKAGSHDGKHFQR
jgi:hypothetical protein